MIYKTFTISMEEQNLKKKPMINYYVYLHVSISAPAIFPVGPK
jgi:hypothetical protein